MKITSIFAAAAISGAALTAMPGNATPITYVYDQTSSSVPGFNVTSFITIDGGFGNLPTISNIGNPGPYNFGNLLAFSISMDSRFHSLGDFIAKPPLGTGPEWTITPGGINFLNFIGSSDFHVLFGSGQISFNTDGPSSFGCNRTNVCHAQGVWLSTVPEPSTMALFGMGIAGVIAMRRRTFRRSSTI